LPLENPLSKVKVKRLSEMKHLGKADLHIHSNCSDARPSIEEVLEYVQNKTDLDVIAITDHDTVKGAIKAAELVKNGNYRFEVIVGEEITAKEGHILGLFLTEKIKPNQSAHETIKQIHDQGGIAVASHPFQHSRLRNPNMAIMDGVGAITLFQEKNTLDGVEIVNGTPTLQNENLKASFLNKTTLFLAEVGASDAHIVEAIGMGYTLFEGKSAADLKRELLERQTQAMHKRWRLSGLFKYLFFFIPKGLRMGFYTLIKGRRAKKIDLIGPLPKNFHH